MEKLKVLDLFSGIGGFSLGLERTGCFETVAFCEIDNHARKILKKHWPEIKIYNDVSSLDKETLNARINVVTGGFPCQDLSIAGRKGGLSASRSGLWGEMHRIICEYRPEYVIIENVANLLNGENGQWFTKLLSDLASIRYDAQWHVIPASAVGTGHHRQRVWVIAYPNQERWDVPEKIFNSIALQISKIRTPRSVLALLSNFRKISINASYPDHRKLDGISEAVDSFERLGNSIHPKIAEIIGNAILDAEYIKNPLDAKKKTV